MDFNRDICWECGGCSTCHLPKTPNYIQGWSVNIPPGYPWINVPEQESEEARVTRASDLPRYFDFDGKPCSMWEAIFLKYGSGRNGGRPNPKSRVGVTYLKYRKRWYAVLTDFMEMNQEPPIVHLHPGTRPFIPIIYEAEVSSHPRAMKRKGGKDPRRREENSFRYAERYPTKELAAKGHRRLVRELKSGKLHADLRRGEKLEKTFLRLVASLVGGGLPVNRKSRYYKYKRR